MTVHEQLIAIGANDREAHNAETLLARFVPLGRAIIFTDEIVAAARTGDIVLLAALLADEGEPDDELAALRARAKFGLTS
jgi:hypothetical protein